ncbi:leucine--tRNA ligase [Actinomadura sp. 9N407]|uniref:leucine--tRNA ligase n=1 Tax=Actinomadura sp. 9N407 TaxID=3375154 RepID=UPI0037A1DE22
MSHRYDAHLANEIELRWQERWNAEGTFDSPNPAGPLSEGFERMAGRRPFYVLDMFPYPSGAGLHVGHPLGYIGTDAFARYRRMNGDHVMHTFGYDAFGLPAEQYAIDTGRHPRETTTANIATYRRQLRRLGLGHDARREISTTDPGYYRWTQWIFLRLFGSWADERTGRARPIEALIEEFASGARTVPGGRDWADLDERIRRRVIDGHRLAYVSEELVNWCPALGTVLANEEVTAEGRSDLGDHPVYRRPMRQWMLRISDFAQRLIDDLDLVDWPEPLKRMQRNWIGAADGAFIRLSAPGRGIAFEVFTTRPDTLYGATYAVLAPEHPLVDRFVPDQWPGSTPQAWRGSHATPRDAVAAYRARTERLSDRQRTTETTGKTGAFTGAYVMNPVTASPIPVFVADYVLMGYGTGAIMAVPAHDQRDLDFAHTYGLAVRPVLRPPAEWLSEHGTDPARWRTAFDGNGAYRENIAGPELFGLTVQEGIRATIEWLERLRLGRGARSYRLRDWLFSRQRYWGEPFPIVYDEHGMPIALPDDALPVLLPEMTDFRPEPQQDDTGTPVPPLAKAKEWATVELDLGEGPKRYRRELNTMPQWAGSCWYYLRYLDPTNKTAFVDPGVERYWMAADGVDLYVGGVEHAVLHLLYARFWHKVLYDLGHVSTPEPFGRLFNQGSVLADAFTDERGMFVPAAEVIQAGGGTFTYQDRPVTRRAGRMGKSRKNGVSPGDVYDAYGADTLRLHEMAMGPLEADRPWRTDDIAGVHRFLQRLWRNIIDEETGATRVTGTVPDTATLRKLHQTIAVVRDDFEGMRYNTAIARLMQLTTHAARLEEMPRELAEALVLMVAPLAPHIAEELWSRLGHQDSLAYAPFPEADPSLAAEPAVTIPVQIDGRTRFTLDVPAGASGEEIERLLNEHADLPRHTAGLTVRRLVIVPGRIANIVTG